MPGYGLSLSSKQDFSTCRVSAAGGPVLHCVLELEFQIWHLLACPEPASYSVNGIRNWDWQSDWVSYHKKGKLFPVCAQQDFGKDVLGWMKKRLQEMTEGEVRTLSIWHLSLSHPYIVAFGICRKEKTEKLLKVSLFFGAINKSIERCGRKRG